MVLRYNANHQGKMVCLTNPGARRPSPNPVMYHPRRRSRFIYAFHWLMCVPLEMCVTIIDAVIIMEVEIKFKVPILPAFGPYIRSTVCKSFLSYILLLTT